MAREVLFWPGMRESSKTICEVCGTCAHCGTTAPKEPMRSLPIPIRPWQIVSKDVCVLPNQSYPVIVFHFSDWIEVDKLWDIVSFTVIEKRKVTSYDMGLQPSVRHDNGSRFISEHYILCAVWFQAHHLVPLPTEEQKLPIKLQNPSLLKKADDFHSALLLKRNIACSYDALEPFCLPLIISCHLPWLTLASWKETFLRKGIIAKHTTTGRRVWSTNQSKLAVMHMPAPRKFAELKSLWRIFYVVQPINLVYRSHLICITLPIKPKIDWNCPY